MNETKTLEEDIDLFNDATFKSLFRSKEAREMVIDFLTAVTGISYEELENAEFQSGELPKKNIHEKGKIADIIIKLENNNRIIIEMNQFNSPYLFDKNISYAMSIASESIPINPTNYPKIFLISIDKINKFKTKEGELDFMLRDQYGHVETKILYSKHLVVENILKPTYNGSRKIKRMMEFLNMRNVKDMEEEFSGEEMYMSAIRKVKDLSLNPEFVGYYDKEEAIKWDMAAMKQTGIDEGKALGEEIGRELGEKEKQDQMVRNMLNKNMSLEDIAEIASINVEEVNYIKEELENEN